jgi:hypothetical protein
MARVTLHRARVMDKMGARSLSELIRLALAAGVPPTTQRRCSTASGLAFAAVSRDAHA